MDSVNIAEMDHGVMLELIEEAVEFNGDTLGPLGNMKFNQDFLPTLLHYGFHCKYLNLLMLHPPFELVGKDHPGFKKNSFHKPDENERHLVAKTAYNKLILIGFAEKDGYLYSEDHIQLDNQSNVYASLHEIEPIGSYCSYSNRYVTIGSSEGKHKSYLITGKDCLKQLMEWGLINEKTIFDFLFNEKMDYVQGF
jgi:hypothetical protein